MFNSDQVSITKHLSIATTLSQDLLQVKLVDKGKSLSFYIMKPYMTLSHHLSRIAGAKGLSLTSLLRPVMYTASAPEEQMMVLI